MREVNKIREILLLFRKEALFGWLLLVIFNSSLLSQFSELKFENLTTRDGLSQNTVTCITQDKYGFMWFGTFNGLNRFDGYDFKTYYKENSKPTSLNSSRCTDLAVDSAGNLWIRTPLDKFNKYNYESDDFSLYDLKDLPAEVVRQFDKRTQEQVFSFKNHSFRFHYNIARTFTYINRLTNDSTKDVVDVNNPYGVRDNYLIDLFIDKFHTVWLGSFSSGVFNADLQRKHFSHFLMSNKISSENNIRAICEDGNILWLGTRDRGMIEFNRKTNEKKYFRFDKHNKNSLVHDDVRKIYKDNKGYIWICTKGGICRFDPKAERFLTILQGSGTDFKCYVFNVTQDHLGQIWFTTFDGLCKYDEKNNKVLYYREPEGVTDYNTLRFVFEDENKNFWLGTEVGGITLLKRKLDFGDEKEKFEAVRFVNDPANPKSLSDNRVYSYCKDAKGNFWFGTGAGLNKYNPQTNTFDVINSKDGLANDMILGILSDNNENLWVSHKRGLSKINLKTKVIVNYSIKDGLQDIEFNEDAYYKSDKTGEMFFGGPKGINSFFPENIESNKEVPQMMITNLFVEGEPVEINDTINGKVILSKNIILTKEIVLNHNEKSFALTFAGLNYANPENHRYAYMLEGFDNNWIYTDAKLRRASYTNLEPGTYIFKVKGCNSDGVWNETPRELTIVILPPVWETWWFRSIMVLIFVFIVVYLIYYRTRSLKIENTLLEEKVGKRTKELKESNEKIRKQYNEILAQNSTIVQKTEEIYAQRELLEDQKSKIEKAYAELDLYRNNLEKLIEERTRELVLAKEKAEESDRLKTSFLSNLSHEIRTPLNAILGFTSFVFDDSFTQTEKRDFKTIVDNNCSSLLDLIEEIVNYAIIEAANVELDLSHVKLAGVIDEIKKVYEIELNRQQYSIVESKDVVFKTFIDPSLKNLEIITDGKRLIQAISYLVNNAIKFTQNGYIEVGCKLLPQGSFVQFYVKDTGIGISTENQKHIFQRFRKIEKENAEVFRGIGLGLTIAEQIINLLGGEINLESEEGKGSTFFFQLPIKKVEKRAENIPVNPENKLEIPDLKDMVILIAEDDPGNFIYLERLIKKTGAKVLHAVNGNKVLEIMKNNPSVSMILMDIKMPELDGISTLDALKKLGVTIPVVAQTAYAFSDEIEKIKEAGFDGFITKPIFVSNLYQLLPQLLVN
jgi:signal transduction histidine kinase/ligand-binding sensor domain-containing protein/CheY-like chemotaxis protein